MLPKKSQENGAVCLFLGSEAQWGHIWLTLVCRRSPGLDQSGPACPAPPWSKVMPKVMLMHAEMHGPVMGGGNGWEWKGKVGNVWEWVVMGGNGWEWVVGMGGNAYLGPKKVFPDT